ncbi:stage V sporulation protein AD [Ornithinibacillus gellani]|uniref:stage V sporulation protein AD n=1 Tax=Ornithinibacillus gellani TaxID=2293253 RepID=UPI001680F4C6|nr:stage V sporulation protein AD [Ornithinibacillus gellani]
MLQGQTWIFKNRPRLISTGTVGGPFEAKGNIPEAFDILHDDIWMKQTSFEKAQQTMLEEACQYAIKNSNLSKEQIDFFIGGDLINQMTPTTFTADTIGIPYFGIFSACASSMEGLALAAHMINSDGATHILTGTASHNAATERQFRYPTEYGGQKPPTSQWTVTGAGCGLVAKTGAGPHITSATIGKVVDMGMTDPFHMGGAMAPAAVDTIIAHLRDLQLDVGHYDLIITGDLGHDGRKIALDLLLEKGIAIQAEQFVDCGAVVYRDDQPVLSGGSGTACSAIGIYGHYVQMLKDGTVDRILAVATGALHSPMSVQQKGSIPCIAHAVSLEAGSDAT